MKNGKYVIGIDPGHGGADPGALSVVDGVTESQLTLELSLMVKERLEHNNFEVVMTRTDDTSPGDVSVRGTMLGKAGCDYAISIHFNAFTSGTANGTEIYVPSKEQYANVEYRIMNGLTVLFKERTPVCKARNYSNGTVSAKNIDPKTLKFKEIYNQSDYYGVIRGAWNYGVSCDLLEVCYITNQNDYFTYVDDKEYVADIIASGICGAYGVEYKKLSDSESSSSVENPNVGTFTEEEWKKMNDEIESLKKQVSAYQDTIKRAVEILNK